MNTIDTIHNRYGAAELKEGYNRNLALALVLSIVLHGVAIVLYLILNPSAPVTRDLGHVLDRQGPITIEGPVDPEPKKAKERPTKRGGGSAGGPTKSGGVRTPSTRSFPLPTQMPLDDSLLTDGAIPNDHGGAFGGDGRGNDTLPFGGGSGGDDGPPANKPLADDSELDPDQPSFAEDAPTYDSDELGRKVKYPEIARRARLEGVVVVRALIARTGGRPLKVMIDQSASPMLSEAAMEAVLAVVFTPAIQNGIPVPMWVQVPITFELD